MKLSDASPQEHLDLLCRILNNPALPRMDLNRVCQLRFSWTPQRGIPLGGQRAVQQLAKWAIAPEPAPTPEPEPEPTPAPAPKPAPTWAKPLPKGAASANATHRNRTASK